MCFSNENKPCCQSNLSLPSPYFRNYFCNLKIFITFFIWNDICLKYLIVIQISLTYFYLDLNTVEITKSLCYKLCFRHGILVHVSDKIT